MRGFILAAGFGTRLRPITDNIPKALVTVAGKPLLERSLQFLKNNGIDTIGVNTHHLSEQVNEFRKNSAIPFQIFHEEKIRGTGGALVNAMDFLRCEKTFIIINVDIVCTFDLKSLIQQFNDSNAACALVAFPPVDGKGSIYYDYQSKAYLGAAAGNSNNSEEGTGADFIGVAFYRNDFLSLLTDEDFSIVPVWTRAVKKGMQVDVYVVGDGYWKDTGKPIDLARLHFDIIDRKIELDIPECLQINYRKKTCLNREITGVSLDYIQQYSWIETGLIQKNRLVKNCVVFSNSVLDLETPLEDSLVTPWGVFNLHD